MTAALQLVSVGKRYGLVRKRDALRGVSLTVERGECYGLAGQNGAGKTTLIRLLLGLLAPDSGEVRLLGRRPDDPEARRRVGFVPEAAELPPQASPRALVRRFAMLRGLPLRTAEPAGVLQLERMGLSELLDRPAHRLSKGEKQRVLLALALLGDPELLILDEPTDGLDPLGRTLVRRVLGEERERGRTVFLNSHLLSETERICSRVGILHRGELVREIAPRSSVPTSTAIVLSDPPPPGFRATGDRTVLVDHADAAGLNAELDRLRAAGALVVEVTPQRQDLEASFAAVVNAPPLPRAPVGPPPPEEPLPFRPLRGLVASLRVAREVALDLAARRIGWLAVGFALLVLGTFLWILRADAVQGAAAALRTFGGPGGLVDEKSAVLWLGRWLAGVAFVLGTLGSVLLAALFAPGLLEPRRTILLLAQPVGRGDLATGIFLAVCTLQLLTAAFLVGLLFGGLRSLGLAVPLSLLLVPLPISLAFAAIYAGVLAATFAVRNGVFAGMVGFATFVLSFAIGHTQAARPGAPPSLWTFLYGVLPRLSALGTQAQRLGAGESAALAPFALTLAYVAGMALVVQVLARRSER